MIRLFTVLLLVTSALAGPVGSVDYESSSGASRASSAPTYNSGRLGTGKYSANYATAPGGPASSAATKVTALYGSSQAAENGTSTYNSVSAGPRAASAHGGHPIIGTFATPVNGYAPDQGLPDFFGGYPASPYGVVPPAPFPGYAATPAGTRFDGGYAGAPAVARFHTNYDNGAPVPMYDTSHANTPAGVNFDTSYAHSPAVAQFDTRTSFATSSAAVAAAAAAAAARTPTSGLTGSSPVSKFTPSPTTALGLASASHTPPTSTEAPSNVIGARLAGTGPHGKPLVEPVYATPFAAPGVSNGQPVPVLIYPGLSQGPPVFAPAYYGYGIPDLGYGVGSYEYGRGLIGYGLNYGYGLGTPLEYNALVRKKKCTYIFFITTKQSTYLKLMLRNH